MARRAPARCGAGVTTYGSPGKLKRIQTAHHPIDAAAVRRAYTHLRAAAHSLDRAIPPSSFSVLCTPRTAMDATVVPLADEVLPVVPVAAAIEIGDDVVSMWDEVAGRIIAGRTDDTMCEAVYDVVRRHVVLPSAFGHAWPADSCD